MTIVHLPFGDRVTGQQLFLKIESYECPVCRGENVELIPLNLNEKV